MFCSIKKVKSKNYDGIEFVRYRIYVCERKREEGKVKCIDKLIGTMDYFDITEAKTKTIGHVVECWLKEKNCYNKDLLDNILLKISNIRSDLEIHKAKKDQEKQSKEDKEREEREKKAEEEEEWLKDFFKRYNTTENGFKFNTSSGINRNILNNTTKDLYKKIVDSGFKKLALERHPDKEGGSTEAMQELNEAKRELYEILGIN